MEKNALNSVFEQVHNAGILERGRFGKTEVPLLWVESSCLKELARALRADPELSFDWLENLSVMEVDEILVVSWFLRSRKSKEELVLRSTAMPASTTEAVDLPSLAGVWPEAASQEADVGELFGIRFDGAEIRRRLLHDGIQGYPLRKDFDMRAVLARDPGLGGEAHAVDVPGIESFNA